MQPQPNSRTCFLCGRENDFGLKMTWYNDEEAQVVRARVSVPERFNGYPGVVHGGVVSAILDETAGRSLMLKLDSDKALMMTLKLQVTFRRPVPTDTELEVTGWINDLKQSRAKVAAELKLGDGTLLATCEAVVVRPPAAFMESWDQEREHWHVDEEADDDGWFVRGETP